MRFIKKTITYLLVLAVLAAGYTVYKGWSLYKDVTDEVSVEQKVEDIRSQQHYTEYEELPETYVQAVIAGEDKRFRDHGGFDIIATGRAVLQNIKAGGMIQGGSTITQQLARNMYFDQDKDLARKIAEVFVAFEIEDKYDKDEILELYVTLFISGPAIIIYTMPAKVILVKSLQRFLTTRPQCWPAYPTPRRYMI